MLLDLRIQLKICFLYTCNVHRTVVIVCLFNFSYAFTYNPAIQPRCIVVLGSICKEISDADISHMLEVLAKVLNEVPMSIL